LPDEIVFSSGLIYLHKHNPIPKQKIEVVMKKLTYLVFPILGLSLSNLVYAQAEVEVQWQHPKEYKDVRPTSGTRHGFRQSTFKKLDEYLLELAQSLPDQHKLILTVTDLDLAGQVWPASFTGIGQGMTDIRVIKRIDIPRINFSYELLSSVGKVIQQAKVQLKDMSFLERSNRHFGSESLHYEKNMLKQWFNQEFKALLVSPGSSV
jgi:hypothetical protein